MPNPQEVLDYLVSKEKSEAKIAIKEDAGKPQLSLLPVQFYNNLPVISEGDDVELHGRMHAIRLALVKLAEYSADSTTCTAYLRIADALNYVVDSFPTPYTAAESVARAMEYGAQKYSRNNWRVGFADSRLLDAAMRHLTQWLSDMFMERDGRDIESGLDHRGHAMFEISALLDQIMARQNGLQRGFNDLVQE